MPGAACLVATNVRALEDPHRPFREGPASLKALGLREERCCERHTVDAAARVPRRVAAHKQADALLEVHRGGKSRGRRPQVLLDGRGQVVKDSCLQTRLAQATVLNPSRKDQDVVHCKPVVSKL